jgi:hypothetical protein
MEALPIEEFPVTFTDAFKIVQKMGLEYIWIDSLCIIQDSEEDWQKESSLMESVYGGSVITIAASSARNSTQGCFLKPEIFSGGLRARVTDGGNQRVQDFRSSDVYDRSTSGTYLATRAWALQEKLLPPRTIHFGDRGAFWECKTTLASEYLPDGFPKQLVRPLVRHKIKMEYMWRQIIMLYSAADLSFGKDKLPALSGIARLCHNESEDQYLAGLWRGQIEEQLCWHRWRPEAGSICKRPAWRAPTWSWASIDGRIAWQQRQPRILDTNHAHVLDANITLYGHDPFGQVTAGVIRLACSTMVAGILELSKHLDTSKNEGNATFVLHADDKDKRFSFHLDCPDDHTPGDKGMVYMLPMLSGRTGMATGSGDPKEYVHELVIQGIVLRATGTNKGEFSRIGFFGLYKDKSYFRKTGNNEDEAYKSFLEVLEEYGRATAEKVCGEIIENVEHPEEIYVVTLV